WVTGPVADVVFENPGREPVPVRFDFQTRATPRGAVEPTVLTVSGLADRQVAFTGIGTCSVRFVLPPGRHVLRVACPVTPTPYPGRTLHFGVQDYRLRVENEHPLLTRARGDLGGWY